MRLCLNWLKIINRHTIIDLRTRRSDKLRFCHQIATCFVLNEDINNEPSDIIVETDTHYTDPCRFKRQHGTINTTPLGTLQLTGLQELSQTSANTKSAPTRRTSLQMRGGEFPAPRQIILAIFNRHPDARSQWTRSWMTGRVWVRSVAL